MPQRYWLPLVATWLVFTSADAANITHGRALDLFEKAQINENHAENDGRTTDFFVLVAVIEKLTEEKIDQSREAERERREREDSVVQKRAAETGARSAELAWWQSLWALLQTIFVGIGTFLLLPTLYLSIRTAKLTAKATKIAADALAIELEPFLTIEIVNADKYVWSGRGFTLDGKKVEEIWLVVQNAGKSPATITSIYRRWSIRPLIGNNVDFLEPINWSSPPEPKQRKVSAIPVGGGSRTDVIRTQYGQIRDIGIIAGPHPILDGFLEYRDVSGKEYVTGFCIIYARGIFHTAWINKQPERYIYRKAKTTRPVSNAASAKLHH